MSDGEMGNCIARIAAAHEKIVYRLAADLMHYKRRAVEAEALAVRVQELEQNSPRASILTPC
jgi:hypothetical protein